MRSLEPQCLSALFEELARKYDERPCFGRIVNGAVKTVSYGHAYDASLKIINWLSQHDVKISQDTKIGFKNANNFYARLIYQAVLITKMIAVPIYSTMGDKSALKVLQESISIAQVSVIVSDDQCSIEKFFQSNELPDLKLVIFTGCEDQLQKFSHGSVFSIHTILEATIDHLCDFEKSSEQDAAFYLSTSGTGGNPKIAVLSQRNMFCATKACSVNFEQFNRETLSKLKHPRLYAVLPEAHTFGQLSVFMMMNFGCCVVYPSDRNIRAVFTKDLEIVRPHILSLVPLLMNRVAQRMVEAVSANAVLRGIFHASVALHSKLSFGIPVAFFGKMFRKAFGGNLILVTVGGAPLTESTMTFYRDIVGVSVLQGYGLTEGLISHQTFETQGCNVGKPVQGVEVKLVAADDSTQKRGEIHVRGGTIFNGYYNDPVLTGNSFVGGFFKTGDIGEFDDIVGRMKDTFKLSNGEFINPEKIEAVYTKSKHIQHVFVSGDSITSFLVGFAFVEAKSLKNDKDSVKKLIENDFVILEQKSGLSKVEMPKIWTISDDSQITFENGLITPTLKLRRKQIAEFYRDNLRSMVQKGLDDSTNIERFVLVENS